MLINGSLYNIEVIQSVAVNDVAIVVIRYLDPSNNNDLNFVVTGTSKRDPKDKADPWVGLQLAEARAVEALGRKLMRRARGEVKHNDDIADIKKSQREKKIKRQKEFQKELKRIAKARSEKAKNEFALSA